jgi:hypothetical protein
MIWCVTEPSEVRCDVLTDSGLDVEREMDIWTVNQQKVQYIFELLTDIRCLQKQRETVLENYIAL